MEGSYSLMDDDQAFFLWKCQSICYVTIYNCHTL